MAFSTGVSLLPVSRYDWLGTLQFSSLLSSYSRDHITIVFIENGNVEVNDFNPLPAVVFDTGTWYTPNSGDPPLKVGDFFEVRFTLLSGNTRSDTYPLNTWLRLTGWQYIRNDSLSGSGVVRAEIRELVNPSRIISMDFTLNIV